MALPEKYRALQALLHMKAFLSTFKVIDVIPVREIMVEGIVIEIASLTHIHFVLYRQGTFYTERHSGFSSMQLQNN